MALFRKTKEAEKEQARTKTMPRREGVSGGHALLLLPHVTEKTAKAIEMRRYAFRVPKAANKRMVSESVARQFKVSVERVWVVNTPAKMHRRGNQTGWKPGFKKAIVEVAEGQSIETQ